MEAIDYFNELPKDFDTKVLSMAEIMPLDAAFYMMIGRFTSLDPDDDDTGEELSEMIIEEWPELEF